MKICVADDEKEVRESIIHKLKTLFPYDDIYDIEYGRTALDNIRLVRPDLVFLDIRMPDMDGLEILRLVRVYDASVKAVILSGYDDFEYARKALQFGAVDYILKPADREQLRSIVETRKQEMEQAFLKDIEVSLGKLSEHSIFVHRIQAFNTSLWFDERQGKEIRFDQAGAPEAEPHRLLMTFALNSDGEGVILLADSAGNRVAFHSRQEFVSAMIAGMEQWESLRFFGHPTEFRSDTNRRGIDSARNIPSLRQQILACAKTGDDRSLETALSGWLGCLEHLEFVQLKKECVSLMALLDEGLAQKNEVIVLEEEKLQYWSMWVAKHPTWYELRQNIRKFVLDGVRALRLLESPSTTGWLEFAVQFVNRSHDPNLSLETVAKQAGVHPVTLSRIFKQNTGMNFVKYVVHVRLRHARALLLESDKKIQEIAEEIGYADYRHFRNLFKKRYGLTPSEYRRRNRFVTAGEEPE